MEGAHIMFDNIINRIRKFNVDRDWDQFHSGVHLSKALIVESAELLELYQWKDELSDIEKLKEELADVFIYAIMLSEVYRLDIAEIINKKMTINEIKYPVQKAKGKSDKYTKL